MTGGSIGVRFEVGGGGRFVFVFRCLGIVHSLLVISVDTALICLCQNPCHTFLGENESKSRTFGVKVARERRRKGMMTRWDSVRVARARAAPLVPAPTTRDGRSTAGRPRLSLSSRPLSLPEPR